MRRSQNVLLVVGPLPAEPPGPGALPFPWPWAVMRMVAQATTWGQPAKKEVAWE